SQSLSMRYPAPAAASAAARSREEEQLDLEIRADVVAGDEVRHAAAGELLDGLDEAVLHRRLERAAVLRHHRCAFELDQRLLDFGVDAAEHAGEQVVAHEA